MIPSASPQPIQPAAIAAADLARLLSRAGPFTVSEGMIQSDLAAGAPVNSDGSIHLIHFAAWLAQEHHDGR
jgi:hypothetical protein